MLINSKCNKVYLVFLILCSRVSVSLPESDGRKRQDREAGFLSDTEDELTDSQRTGKHSEIYSATVPSIDSAMSSWDSSGFDAGYSSQGEVHWRLVSSCLKHYSFPFPHLMRSLSYFIIF